MPGNADPAGRCARRAQSDGAVSQQHLATLLFLWRNARKGLRRRELLCRRAPRTGGNREVHAGLRQQPRPHGGATADLGERRWRAGIPHRGAPRRLRPTGYTIVHHSDRRDPLARTDGRPASVCPLMYPARASVEALSEPSPPEDSPNSGPRDSAPASTTAFPTLAGRCAVEPQFLRPYCSVGPDQGFTVCPLGTDSAPWEATAASSSIVDVRQSESRSSRTQVDAVGHLIGEHGSKVSIHGIPDPASTKRHACRPDGFWPAWLDRPADCAFRLRAAELFVSICILALGASCLPL